MTYAKTYEAVAKDPPGGLVRPGLPDLPDHPRPQLSEAPGTASSWPALTDTDQIKQCIDECTARIEIGLHYQIPYPRPIHLPPMGLTPLRGRGLRSQEKLRKLSKPVYLKSHDEIS
ncbi:LYR motif-containing protein 1 isoform X10 [Meles meles]|uniref:LYR motif-containing protein 1 isoform X10 n=1 Tax=Meles meles TaxID=9662 RepID=UPI001E69BCAE|nr:LYR motif-containing protein 1 isoform X10 [Meles meles]